MDLPIYREPVLGHDYFPKYLIYTEIVYPPPLSIDTLFRLSLPLYVYIFIDKIVTGSLSGKLRIYNPSSPTSRRNNTNNTTTTKNTKTTTTLTTAINNYAANDLLLETNLNAPILQLAAGCFQPLLPTTLCLAILHPHKLIIYTVTTTEPTNLSSSSSSNTFDSKEESSNNSYSTSSSSSSTDIMQRLSSTGIQQVCRLQRQYEHIFTQAGSGSFSAYNMCYGPFGAATSRTGTNMFTTPSPSSLSGGYGTVSNGSSGLPDSILVQSMDGQVAVFEGTAPGPRRQLEGILLPGPIAYIPRTDTLITTSSDLCLVGYRYSSLHSTGGSTIIRNNTTSSSSSNENNNNSNISSASASGNSSSSGSKLPTVKPDWSINLGEITSYLHVGRFDKQTLDQVNLTALSSPYTLFSPVDLLVIGDKTFFNMRDNGNSGNNHNNSSSSSSSSSKGSSSSSGSNNNNNGGAIRIPPSSFASTAPIRTQKRLEYIPIASCLIPRNGTSSSLPHLGKYSLGTGGSSSTDSANDSSSLSSSASVQGHNLMVCSANGTIYVYREDTVIWSAKLTCFVPVAMGIGKFHNQSGLTVFLSERGDISVDYMGTDPPTGSLVSGSGADALTTGSRALDFTQMENEYKRLLNVIRDAAISRESSMAKDTLSFPSLTVPTVVDDVPRNGCTCQYGAGILNGSYGNWYPPEDVVFETVDSVTGMEEINNGTTDTTSNGKSVASSSIITTVRIGITWSGMKALSNVQLAIQPPSWVRLPRGLRTLTIPSVPGKGETISNTTNNDDENEKGITVLIPFLARTDILPSDTKCSVIATYTGEGGETRSHSVTFHVPLCLACQIIPPVKSATYKCTLDTNRGPVPLTSLFPDMFTQPSFVLTNETVNRVQTTASSVISFRYWNGMDVTILLSKANGRYRLQGSTMEAVTLVAYVLADRLSTFWESTKGPGTIALQNQINDQLRSYGTLPPELQAAQNQLASNFTISFTETIPQTELFEAIDQHLQYRQAFLTAYSALNDRTHEYRLITKRLLVRFKDRTPAPLHYLDVLLERSHSLVLEATENVLHYQELIGQATVTLASRIRLFLLLLQYATRMDNTSMDILRAYLNPDITDTLEYGWEESTDSALTYLLRYGMRVNGINPKNNSNNDGTAGGGSGNGQEFTGPPSDSNKLRKHLTILVDRLLKGATIIPSLG